MQKIGFDSSPESFEAFQKYVHMKLLAGGIDDYNAEPRNPKSAAAYIVYDAWRQPNVKYFADLAIEQTIKYPPLDPRFSLKQYIAMNAKPNS